MWVAHNNKTIIESTQYVQLRDLLWMVTILLHEISIVCAKYTKINWRQIAICMSALILKWEQQEISPDPYLFTVFTDGWWKTLRISFPIMSCRARLYKKIPSIPQVCWWWSQSAQKGSLFWSGSNKRRQTMYGNQSIMLSIVNWPTFQSFWLYRQQLLRVTSRVFLHVRPYVVNHTSIIFRWN